MSRDPRFDILFEPLGIGPVTAPNRFYQVPHCSGMGYQHPATLAAMREVKAEGGWGVVNTEYCSIHPSSDDLPAPFASLWDDDDVRNMAATTEAVHRHGALAGVELWHGGLRSSNHHSRETAIGPWSAPAAESPWQCMRMDRCDVDRFRHWHMQAALRACTAGFDIVYAYAAHTYLLAQFLDPASNPRTDDYGGVLANRSRLLREVLEDMREAIGSRCAIAVRIEVRHQDGGGREERDALLESISALVDLFDVTVPDYAQEMGSSRFVKEASLQSHVRHVRELTGKPVVSVGRFTSPETMLSQVRNGVVDFIGAARPSIADPFLPNKIRDGRPEDIRECIGCNICYAQDGLGVPIRCTQNPTMGEEWRRGWHPEHVPAVAAPEPVLIVGAGPAGLEAAVTLGRRGFPVLLAESSRDLGGRVNREAKLPGLAEWARVRDWRVQQLRSLPKVEVFRKSPMSAEDVRETGIRHVVVATGSGWRADGRGRSFPGGVASYRDSRTLTPDRILDGERPAGKTIVFDDDHYYIASAIAELLAREGIETMYVTAAGVVSEWSKYTAEQARVHARLLESGVEVVVSTLVSELGPDSAQLQCVYSGARRLVPCAGFVPVTSREPEDALWQELQNLELDTLVRVGDCKAPGLIAHAVYDGHRFAREFSLASDSIRPRRERPRIDFGLSRI